MESVGVEAVKEALDVLRRMGGEPARIEAKRAAGGMPKSVRETLSAFSNTDGGTILLGVDEASGFGLVDLTDPPALRDALVQMSRDDLTPPLQIGVEVVEVEDRWVVVAEVPPAPADRRPVYVTAQGISGGSYLRGGDGDRHMTEAEIALVMAARTQPLYDREVVDGTAVQDLDDEALRRTLRRIRAGFPKLAQSDDPTVLFRLGITAGRSADAPLTLAGLLAYGQFPQQFFPQLMVSVVVHSPDRTSGTRFLDNQTVRGSIPEMIETTLSMLRRNLAVRAVISDRGSRVDEVEYPLEAVREALVNALMHRDYSPVTRGTQVQVELFPDRLVVRSPGGLYGGVTVDELGEAGISSSRNAVLASLLADTYLPSSNELVAENRSSGIPAMLAVARSRGLPRPSFRSSIASFMVTMARSELLSPETRRWIAGLGAHLPTPAHQIAVAMLHEDYLTNEILRQWGVDRVTAGQVLRDLVDQGLALKEGGRRYARYVLDPAVSGRTEAPDLFSALPGELTPDVGKALKISGEATAGELAEATGLSRRAVQNHLRNMMEAGTIDAVGPTRSPKRRYRWIGIVD
ncbi:ATP-dependent DNA helicase RecG [Actinoplanes campanulatus]|uniref:ATP-dependent DNA helicase RecG n=1 Tax=Actinoplanes campanulatus TaxID=113559 RepID=A0A7W5AJV1_9ACTN|nr:ATP-binding protein [Actinoplanes campanulatus]MBB3097623.1 ATP-dependent DNA helicase RecG [Actinoplanes campanulatus]GGN27913.1 dihydroorotate dehydrogenase [Actinoplanes campanulatus]GID37913.1 dihydroorotate dehydrogenase [Actinoplanes campanulatus]